MIVDAVVLHRLCYESEIMVESLTTTRLGRVASFAILCLYSNRRRSALALFGISIGLAAVVGLSMIGNSAQTRSLQSFDKLALDIVAAEVGLDVQEPPGTSASNKGQASARKSARHRSPAQWQAALEAAGAQVYGVTSLRWAVYRSSCTATMPQTSEHVTVATAGPGFFSALGMDVGIGRDLHELDGRRPWVVLGSGVAQQLSADGLAVQPGQAFILCGGTAYVAGVLKSSIGMADLLGESPDDTVFIQLAAFQQMSERPYKLTMIWRLASESQVQDAVKHLRSALRNYSDGNPQVRSAAAMLALKRDQTGQYAKLIALLGGISVLVGGFGIMNVMLVMALERRYDIAVCMALGANGFDVGFQFLVESTLLGVVGGLLGVVLGHALTLPVLYWLDMPLIVDVGSSVLAISIGAVVGIVSGIYPAWRVSCLDPAVVLAS